MCAASGVSAVGTGMLPHIDGSRHKWFQDKRWNDLIVDAPSLQRRHTHSLLRHGEFDRPVVFGSVLAVSQNHLPYFTLLDSTFVPEFTGLYKPANIDTLREL
jgi:hypothetical protein